MTSLGAGFRYQPQWSPDSKKLVFVDNAMRIYLHDVESKKTEAIDRQMWQYSGQLARFQPSWSADSRWLAYECDLDNRQTAIVLYDTREKKRHQVTSGFYDDDLPAFDPDGKYLYYRTKRWFDPIYSDFEPTWVYANGQALVAVPLRKDVPSPLAPRNDDEPLKKEAPQEDKKEAPKKEPPPGSGNAAQTGPSADHELFEVSLEERKPEASGEAASSPKTGEKSERRGAAGEARKPKPVEIDIEAFEARGVVLPPGGGQFADLIALPGKLLFTRYPRAGSGTGTHPLSVYDLEKREEKMIFDDAEGVELSADGKKLLVLRGRQWGILNALANDAQKLDKPLNTGSFEALIDPPSEWRQIFTDA